MFLLTCVCFSFLEGNAEYVNVALDTYVNEKPSRKAPISLTTITVSNLRELCRTKCVQGSILKEEYNVSNIKIYIICNL